MRNVYPFALCLVLITAGPAAAQNLVVNPTFDSNVAGWSLTTAGTFTHDSLLDADANPSSGSGRLDNTSPVASGTSFAAQCVAVTGGSAYDFWAAIRIPSGQTQTGRAAVVVNFNSGAGCGGSDLGGEASPVVFSTTTDTWVTSPVLNVAAPDSAVSAQVALWVTKIEDIGSFVVNFDNVAFGVHGSISPPPTATPSVTSTPTPTSTLTITPTPTSSVTPANTPTQTPTGTATSTVPSTPTPTPTGTATATQTQTLTPSFTQTPTQPPTATPTSTVTSTPTPTPSFTPTATASRTPTSTPTNTATPVNTSTQTATIAPSVTPTPTQTPTPSPTSTVTRTPAPSPSVTSTPTSRPTGTRTVTARPTATPTPTPLPCTGDCDGSGEVTVPELILLVNVALSSASESACPGGDVNADGVVTVDEIVLAVGNALAGCPASATVTPTPRSTPPPATPAKCPFAFTTVQSFGGRSCVYRGRWNPSCGTDQLRVTWVSTGWNLLATIASDPPDYLCASVTSSTTATLTGWNTVANCTQATPLDGTVRLVGDSLVISPAAPPFALEGCNFQQYVGSFESVTTP